MTNHKISVGDRVRGVRFGEEDGGSVEGVVRGVNRLGYLALELDDGLVDIVYPGVKLVEPNPDTIQQYEYDSGPKFPTKVFTFIIDNKFFGRRAYLTREEAEYDAEDISEFLGEPFEIRELTIHQNTEVPF